MTAVLAAASLGCGAIGKFVPGGSSGSSSGGSNEPTQPPPPTFNPDAQGEVVGTNCHYDEGAQSFKYDLSIQNASDEQAFKYHVSISFSGGGDPFADDSFGSQSLDITVGPGKERKLTVSQSYHMTKHTYFSCTIESARKELAD